MTTPVPLRPSFAELFTPKLVTVWREGYDVTAFKADAIAGLTVAIVALPLSMAIAIASGLSPNQGLFTAIVGGFVISALGGSRFQIGGPAGAFIVLVANIVEKQGYDGLVLAAGMAGAILVAAGFLRLGAYVKYIPFPVVVGFTSGIAVIIFASQVKDLLGLRLDHEPAALLPKLQAIAGAIGTYRPETVSIAALSLALILLLRRFRPTWPGFLIAIIIASAANAIFKLDLTTIGTQFGALPNMLPAPALPAVSMEKVRALLPDALAIALLGSIESLLSAVVADGMTGRRHRSNCELVAQGFANLGAALFGGMPVTGAIARTATNIRAGARGPAAGILHALYLLLFMLAAAPLAAYIPLAALGAVLAVVAWNMAEQEEFITLLRASSGDAIVLLSTFLLTIFEDLTVAIAVGVTLGAFVFLHRLSNAVEIERGGPLVDDDVADTSGAERTPYRGEAAGDQDVVVYRINGAFFFGSTAAVIETLNNMGQSPRIFIFDFINVPIIDTTAAKSLEGFAHKLAKRGTRFIIAAARPSVRRTLLKAGLKSPQVRYAADVAAARVLDEPSRQG